MRASWFALALTFVLVSGCMSAVDGLNFSTKDFASGDRFSKLEVEIDYVEGKRPSDAAVALLKTRINERLSKPDGVDVQLRGFSSSKETYTINDLKKLETDNRDKFANGKTLVLYVLYVNGHSSDDNDQGKVLGVQYGESSIAIFKETVDGAGGLFALFGATDIEKAVLVHEFGHAIGLVNHGISMEKSHEDSDHRGHSNNKESVMYWAVETTLGLGTITGTIPTDFDADDKADLKAAGGK